MEPDANDILTAHEKFQLDGFSFRTNDNDIIYLLGTVKVGIYFT